MESLHPNAANTGTPNLWAYVDEIAHRTMNDYTFMLAVVEGASRANVDADSERALDAVKHRLRAGVEACRMLRRPSTEDHRRLDRELERLCAVLSANLLAERSILLTISSEPIELPAQRCWEVCLVVSELVTNAAKHAFAVCAGGEMAINLRRVNDSVLCVVSDNGAVDGVGSPGRGSAIVNAIAHNLGGVIWRRHTRNGSAVVLSFRASQRSSPHPHPICCAETIV